MSNTISTTQKVMLEAIDSLVEQSVLIKNTYKDYGNEFGGDKRIGSTLYIRKPTRFSVGTTADITSLNRDMYEGTVALSTVRRNVAIDLPSDDRTFKTDMNHFRRDVIDPGMSRLAREVDLVGFNQMLLYSANRYKRATLSNDVAFNDVLGMRARLSQQLAPEDRRALALGAGDAIGIVSDTKGLFQSASQIESQYEKGMMGIGAGYKFYETESVYDLAGGTAASAGTVNSALSEGATSVVVTGGTASKTIKAGQAFTVDTIYAIDPQTQKRLNYLYTFVAAADVSLNGSGAGTITINTPVYTTNTNVTQANVHVGTSASSAALSTVSSGNVTLLEPGSGTAGYLGKMMFGWNPMALAFASVELPNDLPGCIVESVSKDGISMRYTRFHNGITDVGGNRLDIQFGFAVTYPEAIVTSVGKYA